MSRKRKLVRHLDAKHPSIYRMGRESLRDAHRRAHRYGAGHRKHSRTTA